MLLEFFPYSVLHVPADFLRAQLLNFYEDPQTCSQAWDYFFQFFIFLVEFFWLYEVLGLLEEEDSLVKTAYWELIFLGEGQKFWK